MRSSTRFATFARGTAPFGREAPGLRGHWSRTPQRAKTRPMTRTPLSGPSVWKGEDIKNWGWDEPAGFNPNETTKPHRPGPK